MFLGTAIWFLGSLVIVVACYRAMQRVTVILKKLELYLNNDCVFANANANAIASAFVLWKLSDFLPLFTAVYRLCFKMRNNIYFKLNKMLTP